MAKLVVKNIEDNRQLLNIQAVSLKDISAISIKGLYILENKRGYNVAYMQTMDNTWYTATETVIVTQLIELSELLEEDLWKGVTMIIENKGNYRKAGFKPWKKEDTMTQV